MENNLPSIKPHTAVKARFDIVKHEEGAEFIYGQRSVGSSQSKKGLVDTRARSLAEVRGKLKAQNTPKSARYSKWVNQRKSEQKQDMTFDIGRSIASAKGISRKQFRDMSTHNASFSCYDGWEKGADMDSKSMKGEVERLHSLVATLKEVHREEEETLHMQISNLQKELELIKIEFSETVELLAMVLGNYKDPRIPRVVDEKIMQILAEKQANLKIIMQNVLRDSPQKVYIKSSIPTINTNDLNDLDRDSLSSTGRFQSLSDAQYFPELTVTPTSHINVIALYDYHPSLSEHLDFCVGDRITVIKQLEEGWWYGMLKDKTGKFPSNYALMD